MPISDCEVRDPRIRRTRQLLQGALQALMRDKKFDEISVQDIAETASVNRATFYDHYTDKYALLEATVAGGFHKLVAEREVTFDGSCPQAIGALVLATCDFLSDHNAGSNWLRQNAFEPLMDAAIIAAIRRILMPGLRLRAPTPLPADVIATAASWAMYGAVKEWLASPGRAPAKKIVPPILTLILPMIGMAS